MADWTGKTIGDYRLDAALAPDRYGERYRATAGATGATVEVRVIAPPAADDRWFADRVASALRRYEGISAPDLAPLLEVGAAEGSVYTVGPLLTTETLRTRLGAPLPLDETIRLLTPIAGALDALHARYMPHGGVRPEAIVLDPAGSLLRDAGVAPALAAAARLSATAASATPLAEIVYRAPEAGTGSIDPRADIYSLAVVAYEALTGRVPFSAADAGDDPERLAALHRDAPPPSPRERNPTLSPATEAAILRGLAKYPFERPERAGALLDLLRADGATTGATTTSSYSTSAATFAPPPAAWMQAKPTVPSTPTAPTMPTTPSTPTTPVVPATPATYATPAATTSPTPLPPVAAVAPPAPAIVPAVPAAVATPITPPVVAPPVAPEPYEYQSPEADLSNILARPAMNEDLRVGRTALVTALAGLANRRALALAVERRQVVSTLQSVEAARGGRQRQSGGTQSRGKANGSRPTPKERAARHAERQRDAQKNRIETFEVSTDDTVAVAARAIIPTIIAGVFIGTMLDNFGIGFLIVLGGIVYGLYAARSASRYRIICKAEGYIVEDTLLPWRTPSIFYRWSEVTEVRYHEELIGKKDSQRLISHVTIAAGQYNTVTVSDRFASFDIHRLLEIVGGETRQLPYLWVPNDQKGRTTSGLLNDHYRLVERKALERGDAS